MKQFKTAMAVVLIGSAVMAASLQAASVHTPSLPAGVVLDKSQKLHLYLEGEAGEKSKEPDKFLDPADAERTAFRTSTKPKDNYAGSAQAYDGTRHFLYGADNASRDSYSIYWEDLSQKLEAGKHAAYVRALPSPNAGTQTYTLRVAKDRTTIDAPGTHPVGSVTTEAKAEIRWYKIGEFEISAEQDSFRLDVTTKSSSIRFDTVLIVPVSPARGVQLLPPDANDPAQLPGNNFAADRGQLRLEVMQAADLKSIDIELRDETGKVIGTSQPQITKGEGSSGIALVDLPSRGFFRIHAQANYKDGKQATCQTTAAVLGVPISESLRSRTRLGIWNVHGDTALIKAAGARWNRRMTSLRNVTQEQVAAAATQPSVTSASTQPLTHIGVYAFGLPLWSIDLPKGFQQKGFAAPFQKPRDWADIGKIIEAHAKTSMNSEFPRYFEIYNEPEWHWKGSDEDLVKFYAAAAKGIKAAQPETLVLGPGMSGIRVSEFKERWVRHGLLDHLDGILLHAYVSGTAPEGEFIQNVRDLKHYLKSIGREMPLYFTEFGWTSATGTWARAVDEMAQAQYCARSLALLNHEDVAAAVYFCLLYRNEKNPGENAFSVLNNDHTPKPAYVAFANACRWLAGTTPGQLLQLTPSTYLLACRQENRTIAIVWDTQGPQQLMLPSTALRVEDMMGRTIAAGPRGQLSIGPSPIYVELSDSLLEQLNIGETIHVRKGGQVELPWAPLSCPEPLLARDRLVHVPEEMVTGRYLVIGKNAGTLAAVPIEVTPAIRIEAAQLNWPATEPAPHLALRVRSFMEKASEVKLAATFNGVPGSVSSSVQLEANGERELRFGLPELVPGQRNKGQLLAQIEGMGANARDSRPLDLTALSAKRVNSSGAIDWQEIPQVDFTAWGPFVSNKPGSVEVEDCSAQIQAAASRVGLHLRVQVKDDEHKQDRTPMMLWQGDSLQIGLDFDADRAWVANAGGYEGHVRVYELGIGLIAGEEKVWRWISYDPDRDSNVAVEDAKAHITREGNMTTYEVTFPWSSVGLEDAPPVGSKIGFSLVVNDDDSNKPRHGLRLFNGITVPEEPNAKGKDPAAYGPLWLR